MKVVFAYCTEVARMEEQLALQGQNCVQVFKYDSLNI